jgi:uncharacterized SAM-binding protein YcdF (DUF218 family)
LKSFNRINIRKILKKITASIKVLLIALGSISLVMLILSFTTLPFWGYYWLGTSAGNEDITPEYIIVMGGSGMPGTSALMRTYYAADIASRFPDAKIIITLPGKTDDENSSVNLMKKELEIRGVALNRIFIENVGKNTRYQALEIKKMISFAETPIIIVSSPEHIRRSVLTFKKAGFKNIGGLPAFEKSNEAGLLFDDSKLGGRTLFLPEIGGNLQLRYQFWKHLHYEIIITREIMALGFYNLKGWI